MKTIKTAYCRHLLSLGCMAMMAGMFLGSCAKSEIGKYHSKDKLWFTQKNKAGKEVNNLVRSFSHYPGVETLDVPFEIMLIGAITETDREYKLVVVDSLTTALPAEYEIEPTIFRAGYPKDTVWVKLIKSPRLESSEVKLSLYIVENDNFTFGYAGRLSASVTFNNITTRPEWWTDKIAVSFFGPYSKEKFDAFYAYCGLNDIEGLEPSELRKLLLSFKKHIADNDITEKDGSPMIIPIQ